jgi:alcohol dehydrogenase class IV
VLDPELTVGLPPDLTAFTGMDVMTHAVEAFVCPVFHPMCDGIALEAIRLVRLYLPAAYSDGTNLEARGFMQVAAAMGAVAFQKDLGVAHSLSHPLSSEFGVQHGLANAIVLPHVIRFNAQEDRNLYDRVAVALVLLSVYEISMFLARGCPNWRRKPCRMDVTYPILGAVLKRICYGSMGRLGNGEDFEQYANRRSIAA